MEELNHILRDRLDFIYQDFIHDLDHKLVEIRSTWEKAKSGDSNVNALISLKEQCHDLEICSTTFNLFLLADKALKLEKFLSYLCDSLRPLSRIHKQQVQTLIVALENAALDINNYTSQLKQRRWEPSLIKPEIGGNLPLIYILQTEQNWAGQLTEQLRLNYQVRVFTNYHAMLQALSGQYPKLLITDVQLSDKNTDQDLWYENLNDSQVAQLPIIFIADNNDIETRLHAVRSGATWFCTRPIDTGIIMAKIREVTSGIPKDPFRVMVISDDIPMANFYAMVLGQEGMDVTLIDDPSLTLEKIEHSRPELVLMNLSLPGFTALELTEIIRQEDDFAGVAIVFLSDDENLSNQLTAINSGGDDFISLPVEPERLIARISARVSRARTLNTMNHNLFTALRELENQQFALDQHAIVSITNINGTIIYVNDKLCNITGYSRAELIGKDHRILNSGMHDNEFFKNMWTTINEGNVWQGEICNRKKNGDLYWLATTIVPFIDTQSRPYQYVSINSDISYRKFTEKDLLEARDIAINASQAKSDFLSKMSHELRTPLNAVLGFSQLLESSKEHPLSENQLQYITEIHNAGNHLLSLINEVLDLSRIEADQLITENVTIPVSSFLDECVALIQPLAKQKYIEIYALYQEFDELFAYADPLRLKQVMVNLLSNAVKYNKSPGFINIEVGCKQENILIEVTDSGDGIRPDQIDNLFQPFTRLPQHKKIEGVGIGLALCKRLTELMGGRIGVHSSPGIVTTFWIEIPKADQGRREDKFPFTVDANNNKSSTPVKPLMLLYIEDNDSNLLLLKEFLAEHLLNTEVVHAYTIKSGIELAKEIQPDIILMDLELPDMSGFEGFNLLKQEQMLKSIPVIAVSAYADRENIQLALKLGFDDYITKPLDINRLRVAIEKYQ